MGYDSMAMWMEAPLSYNHGEDLVFQAGFNQKPVILVRPAIWGATSLSLLQSMGQQPQVLFTQGVQYDLPGPSSALFSD